jgi:hypothetical protein
MACTLSLTVRPEWLTAETSPTSGGLVSAVEPDFGY